MILEELDYIETILKREGELTDDVLRGINIVRSHANVTNPRPFLNISMKLREMDGEDQFHRMVLIAADSFLMCVPEDEKLKQKKKRPFERNNYTQF